MNIYNVVAQVLLAFAFSLFPFNSLAAKTKTIYIGDGDVAEVRTARGFTTLLQFDSRPKSVVVGDQDAFRVEYVGSALAIKPLIQRATTNIFILSEYDKFTLHVSTSAPDAADYLINIKRKVDRGYPVELGSKNTENIDIAESKLKYRFVGKAILCKSFRLDVQKIGEPESRSVLVIFFRIKRNRAAYLPKFAFVPGDVELLQNNNQILIESLELSALEFTYPRPEVRAVAIIRRENIRPKIPLILRFSPNVAGQVQSPNGAPLSCLKVSLSV